MTRLRLLLFLAISLAAPPGCSRPKAQSSAPPPPPPLIAVPTEPMPSPPLGARSIPKTCEVEVAGVVRLPKKSAHAHAPTVFIARGDCLAPAPQILGFGPSNGSFFVETLVPWGSDLSVCAASEPAPGAPSTLYGKATIRMHAEATGEVEFKNLVINLTPGPPKTFPHSQFTY